MSKSARPRLLARLASPWCILITAIGLATTSAFAVTYDLVTIGNPGNANDSTGYGGVAYEYQMGTYEVTIGQYVEFLNAVAATDTHGLYYENMCGGLYDGETGACLSSVGIARSGSAGSYIYSVIEPSGTAASTSANRPVTSVDWWDAARFANWMANGQPTGAQTPSTTENGAYDLSGWVYPVGNGFSAVGGFGAANGGPNISPVVAKNAINPNTNAPPTFCLPTENEWYKAAYYSPTLNSGSGGYYTYATQSNSVPGVTVGNADNQANYLPEGTSYNLTESMLSVTQEYLTEVGAFPNSKSYYGTFDQNGNVSEWAYVASSTIPRIAGGNWKGGAIEMMSSSTVITVPWNLDNGVGFRLGGTSTAPFPVPEPSAYAMALAGLACGGFSFWRRGARA